MTPEEKNLRTALNLQTQRADEAEAMVKKLLEVLEEEATFDDDTRWTKDYLRRLIAEANKVEGI